MSGVDIAWMLFMFTTLVKIVVMFEQTMRGEE